MSSGLFRNAIDKMHLLIRYLIYTYEDYLALSDLQRLICYKAQTNQT